MDGKLSENAAVVGCPTPCADRVADRRQACQRRVEVMRVAAAGAGAAAGEVRAGAVRAAAPVGGRGVNPWQGMPSVRSTSMAGSTLVLNPMR